MRNSVNVFHFCINLTIKEIESSQTTSLVSFMTDCSSKLDNMKLMIVQLSEGSGFIQCSERELPEIRNYCNTYYVPALLKTGICLFRRQN